MRWPKRYIKLAQTSPQGTSLPLPPIHTHGASPRPTPLGLCKHVSSKDVIADEGAEHGMHHDEDPGLPLGDELEHDGYDQYADLGIPSDESVFQDTPPVEPDEQPTQTSKLTPNTLLGVTREMMAGPTLSVDPLKKKRWRPSNKKHSSTFTNDKPGETRTMKKFFAYKESSKLQKGAKGHPWWGIHIPGQPIVPTDV